MRDIVVTGMEIAGEIQENLSAVGKEMGEQLIDAILQADKIYSAGCGRSLLMIRGLAMRLMHIGLKSYVVGETVTPAIGEGDLLIIGSGSGETSTLEVMAEKAKKAGAKLAVITIYPESTLGKMADITVVIHGVTAKVQDDGENHSIQPGGNLFEQSLLIFGDALSMCVADRGGMSMDDKSIMSRHANLE